MMKMVTMNLKFSLLVLSFTCTFVQGTLDDLEEPQVDFPGKLLQDGSNGEYTAEENLGRNDVTEGDIKLDKSTQTILYSLKNPDARDAVTNPVKHWRKGRVPFVFGSVNSRVRSAWRAAVEDYNRFTCIRIVPRTNERDYIHVVSEGGCWSPIGRSGGRQKLSLGRGCEHKGTTIHEIMHALGFFHEQSRRDRDSYVTINWGNIISGMKYNFKKYRHGEADFLGASYDYGSVMHYPGYAFSRNRQPTIVAKTSGVQLGQRHGFSKIDIQQINRLYKCKGTVRPTQPPRPKPPTRPPVVNCRDGNRSCPFWKRYCRSNRYVAKYCKKTCGTCGATCRDNRSSCPRWSRAGFCRYGNRYYHFMTRNCKKSCGKC